MVAKKWYSAEDADKAKNVLDSLPDLSSSRISNAALLEQLRGSIIDLAKNKGYSAADIRSALNSAGVSASVKTLRDIITEEKKASEKGTRKKKVPVATPMVGHEANPDHSD